LAQQTAGCCMAKFFITLFGFSNSRLGLFKTLPPTGANWGDNPT
jgi:hypothetical protein